MKILTVNTYDTSGGAARGAYWLHQALLSKGIDSQMFVKVKSSDDNTVKAKPQNMINNLISKIKSRIERLPIKKYKNRTKTLFSLAWLPFNDTVKKINDLKPDIVHLHWINNGFIKISDIAKIKAPVVWTLRDMWPFTGGCHYSEGCENYQTICGKCKILGSNKKNDLSTKVFKTKAKILKKKTNITIVGLSKWITQCSQKSFLFKEKQHLTIPNLINTKVFKPVDKEKARELWNLPKDKKLVLFGAMSATSDSRKGFKKLSNALFLIKTPVEFVVFGSSKPQNPPNFGFKTHYLGMLKDDVSLVALYNAVDVMVVPSLQESFGKTAFESMSCGTPVVAFGTTGLLDIVVHKKTGYLAKPFEAQDLANGIDWVLENNNNNLSKDARKKVEDNFSYDNVTSQYINLYSQILKDTSKKQ